MFNKPGFTWPRAIASFLGASIMFAAQVGPIDAFSNISEWLHFFGMQHIPAWLVIPTIDTYATFMGAALLLSPALVWGYSYQRAKNQNVGSLRKRDHQNPILRFETYAHQDIHNKQITIVGIKVKNTSDKWLQRCSIRLEDIRAGTGTAVFSDSPLKEELPEKEFFDLAATDNTEVPIAKFDAINSPFQNLGIELLCFSTRKYTALDFTKTYILTIVGTAETGIPNKQNYRLWVEGPSLNQTLRFEEADDVYTL